MLQIGPYRFHPAGSPEELEQVHRLNHQTFVREIPQHADDGSGRLVDKFHDKNHYLVCYKADRLVGMMTWCDEPPFSVAAKMHDPSVLSQPGVRPVEVRLLAVVPEERSSPVAAGLFWALYETARDKPWTHFVISGVLDQRPLHLHLGFEPLGPPVGTGKAVFTPMWLPVGRVAETMGRAMHLWQKRMARATPAE